MKKNTKVKRASFSPSPYWMNNKRKAKKDRDDQQKQRDLNWIDRMSKMCGGLF